MTESEQITYPDLKKNLEEKSDRKLLEEVHAMLTFLLEADMEKE